MRYNCFGYSVISIGFWAQEVVCNQVIELGQVLDKFCIWVELSIQRRLCPILVKNVGSPDIHEYSTG